MIHEYAKYQRKNENSFLRSKLMGATGGGDAHVSSYAWTISSLQSVGHGYHQLIEALPILPYL